MVASTFGCSHSGETPPPQPPQGSSVISQAASDAIKRIQCHARNMAQEDCDQDGVRNSDDAIPGRDDLADDDRDSIQNRFDRSPLLNDLALDSDRDGIPDYRDTYFGNNNEDADGDRLINGFDPQPYAAPPGNTAVIPPTGISQAQLTESLLRQQMGRKYNAELLGGKPDADLDGIPDDIDSTRTEFTNDRDGDGDFDYYDPKPGDFSLNSRNDPYDPRNDEYWED
ncbi:hypothetical protein V6K52_03115 [Knoellia sp. S7-12]|uniref:hypothetical protein n=1 Tax=Knoellia sp. S7-12 TaxID=3126698 RepID=UPI003367FE4F